MPHDIDTPLEPSTFCAILAAAAARGANIVTDEVSVDVSANQAQIVSFDDKALALECYDALTIIGQMYESSGDDIFAVVFTRGIDQMFRVVGHTDEGGGYDASSKLAIMLYHMGLSPET